MKNLLIQERKGQERKGQEINMFNENNLTQSPVCNTYCPQEGIMFL